MGLIVKVYNTRLDALKARLANAGTRAEHTVAAQAAADTKKYVPKKTGSLRQRTRVRGNQIIYPGPYARYLYYGKYMVDAKTGKGPMHFTDDKGNEHIKYRKGSHLIPTQRDLVFHEPGTRSHWFEYSKTQNLEKWLRVAERAVKRDL